MQYKMISALSACVIGLAGLANGHAQTSEVASGNQNSVTELVILGAAAGRTSYGGHPSGGFSAAVVVGNDRSIVDFGRGWQERYYESGMEVGRASGKDSVGKYGVI